MPTPVQALAIIRRALPSLTPAEAHFVWAVTRLETGWGTGWKDNALGQLSHNWGAVTAPTGQGFTYNDPIYQGEYRGAGKDTQPVLTERIHTFKIYPSDEAGAADAGRIMLKPNVREALSRNDAYTAIGLMRQNGYFEASVDNYRTGVKRNYLAALPGTGEPESLQFTPSVSDGWLWLVAAGGTAAWFFRKELGLGK